MSHPPISSLSDREKSGALSFDGTVITYTSGCYGAFSVPLSELAVIGEYTNPNGPFLDDWFLVFVCRNDGTWYEASMYAEGIDTITQQLTEVFGSCPYIGLANSANYASRIKWPTALVGRPLFTFTPVTGSDLIGSIKLFFKPQTSIDLSPDTRSALAPSLSGADAPSALAP
jgi:hypothetical protein